MRSVTHRKSACPSGGNGKRLRFANRLSVNGYPGFCRYLLFAEGRCFFAKGRVLFAEGRVTEHPPSKGGRAACFYGLCLPRAASVSVKTDHKCRTGPPVGRKANIQLCPHMLDERLEQSHTQRFLVHRIKIRWQTNPVVLNRQLNNTAALRLR